MKKEENKIRKAGYKVGLVLGIFFMLVWASVGPYPHVVPTDDGKSWHVIWKGSLAQAAEATPAAGASGILEIFIINHTADHFYAEENTSATLEGHCTANGLGFVNADNQELDIAHTTDFDIVVRVRGNATNCQRGAAWFDTDLNVTLTYSDGSESDAQPDGRTTFPNAAFNTSSYTYLYVNFYWDDSGGSGYSISKGATSEIESIEFAAYY